MLFVLPSWNAGYGAGSFHEGIGIFKLFMGSVLNLQCKIYD